ncbi:MAG TPA: hypothetical protein VMW50_07380 [Dehalococcoidia bacterium]|nr:hypothetical protein [Dehalococcoidia bacterium]
MTRAVAVKGAKLVEGIHKGQSGGLAITVEVPFDEDLTITQEVPFDESQGATPVLIEAMILGLDIENPELREATKKHCLTFLEGWVEVVGDTEEAYTLPLDDFYSQAEAFMAGYEVGLKKQLALQPA